MSLWVKLFIGIIITHLLYRLSQKNKSTIYLCEQSMSSSLFDSIFSTASDERSLQSKVWSPPPQFPGELPLLLLLLLSPPVCPPQHQVTSLRNVLPSLQHFPDDQSIRLRSNLETAVSKFTKLFPPKKFFVKKWLHFPKQSFPLFIWSYKYYW